jgi:hypothetical protein
VIDFGIEETRQIIGAILGIGGVLLSIGHLVWMSVRGINQPYHGFGTWVLLGLALTFLGLLLLRKSE